MQAKFSSSQEYDFYVKLPLRMKFNHLGKTNLNISQLGMGVCFVANKGHEIVSHGIRAAIDQGINYFDTAPYYSNGLDEEILGETLNGQRNNVVISTKIGYTEIGDDHRSSSGLMKQLNESLKRLKTDYVDILQIHEADFRKWWVKESISNEEGLNPTGCIIKDDEYYDFINSPVVDFLLKAKELGKARYIGLTGKDARQLTRVIQSVNVDTIMVAHQFNPVMRGAAKFLLPVTAAKNKGVLIAAPMMRGWLAAPQNHWRTQPPTWMDSSFYKAYFAYVDVADRVGIPLHELTLRWILGEQRQHSIVFGFGREHEIKSNVQSIERGLLPQDLQLEINSLGIAHPLIFQGRTSI
jgi:L-galactose dehydrogenase